MPCEKCRQLQSRLEELEATINPAAMQKRLADMLAALTAAGLDVSDEKFVSTEFVQACFHFQAVGQLDSWIADRVALRRFIRAERGSALAEPNRISQFFDDEELTDD